MIAGFDCSNAVWRNNRDRVLNIRNIHLLNETPDKRDIALSALALQTQEDDPAVLAWWMKAHIGKSLVGTHKDSPFTLYNLPNAIVRGTAKLLLKHGSGIVPGIAQQRCQVNRQVFVNLESKGHETGTIQPRVSRQNDSLLRRRSTARLAHPAW